MPEQTSYDPGVPELGRPLHLRRGRRAAFYAELFGWQAEEAGSPEDTGGYPFFTKAGKKVAGPCR